MTHEKGSIGDRWDAFSERVGQLEKTQIEQGAELLYIRSQLSSVDTTLKQLVDQMSRTGKANWSVWASWLSIGVTVVGMMIFGMHQFTDLKISSESKDINANYKSLRSLEEWRTQRLQDQFTKYDAKELEERLLNRIEQNEREITDHQKDGHPATIIQRVERNREDIKELRSK